MILYDLPKFSSELKWKAISILHEKGKLISAQCGTRGATREHARARGGPQAGRGPRAEAAHGEEARALDYEQNNIQSMLLFL